MTRFKTVVLILTSIFALCPLGGHGQSAFADYQKKKDAQREAYLKGKSRELNDYSERKRQEFEEYRKKKNAAFANYLQRNWEAMPQEKALPAPKAPDPVKPTVAPKDEANTLPAKPVEVPKGDVLPVEIPKQEKPLDIPLTKPQPLPASECMQVDLFGMSLEVAMTNKQKFALESLKEAEIGKTWSLLSGDDYTPMFEDCARYQQEMRLNGWATLQLCKAIGERLQGKGTNEAVVLQTYLMAQLGYDARLARLDNNKLTMLCPSNVVVCQIPYLNINGKAYYLWGETKGQTYTYKNNVDEGTRSIDFDNGTSIRLSDDLTTPHVFTSAWNNKVSVNVSVNKCLMKYYSDMPLIKDWGFYARQPLADDISRQIMPVLKSAISGKSTVEAANELVHFVQTAFQYKTDDEQYGREKTDFKEELFYYPACDCEDRAILFSELVRTLLNLDVVLLYYPGHLCTAVKFREDINGDYVTVEGQRYVICDPTYINASIGRCMPKYQSVKPTIVKIFAGR